jgi:hypothetical protein
MKGFGPGTIWDRTISAPLATPIALIPVAFILAARLRVQLGYVQGPKWVDGMEIMC